MAVTREAMSRMISAVQAKVDALEPSRADNLDETFALEGDEHFRFQTLQSHAHADGTLETDAALLVYAALGEFGSSSNGGWAQGTNLATKVVVTQLMGELLERRLRVAS